MISDILNSLFESNLYLFMFCIPFLAQLGIPIGSMFFILYAGSIATGLIEINNLFFIILFATVIGDITAYLIGRKFANTDVGKFLVKHPKSHSMYIKSKKFFNKHGEISIFISRFLITGFGPAINYIVGLQKYNFKKFLIFVILGEILYALELLLIGYFFQETFEDIMGIISDFAYILVILFILYYVGKKLYIYETHKHKN